MGLKRYRSGVRSQESEAQAQRIPLRGFASSNQNVRIFFKQLLLTFRELVTMLRCSDCGERSPDNATFCILCGARLTQRAPLSVMEPYKATGPTLRLRSADAARASTTQANPAVAQPAAHISAFQIFCPLL